MYNSKEFKDSNVNYMDKDFNALKSALVTYAKTYYPNTYRDFNETSPGMMLIEMAAYVGDVLSFYIDQQYQEMLLPLAEERRNIINVANMLGYKVKPTTPAKVDLDVVLKVAADTSDINNPIPNFNDTFIIKENMQLTSTIDSTIYFETKDSIDFNVSSSAYEAPVPIEFNATTGLVTYYELKRKVRAISGQTKTKTVTISEPKKFLEIVLSEKNVIEIISVTDSNNNKWYEVPYLAQDKIPLETFYTDHGMRNDSEGNANAYLNIGDDGTQVPVDVAVPYTLEYVKTTKRFITEVDEENQTKIVFGNGFLRTGMDADYGTQFMNTEQAGITIPGSAVNIDGEISHTLGDSYSTLGETPSNTILTIQYRTGGGINTNVNVSDLTKFTATTIPLGTSVANVTVNNPEPARGGSEGETADEIKQRAKAFFSTQNRCVTKEDYEARVLNLPAKFGNIAKVIVENTEISNPELNGAPSDYYNQALSLLGNIITNSSNGSLDGDGAITTYIEEMIASGDYNLLDLNEDGVLDTSDVSQLMAGITSNIGTIGINLLSYNNKKELTATPELLKTNLSNYLSQYRMLTDTVVLLPGFIINFGVLFDVTSHKSAIKQEVKINCIKKIIDYFNISKMQFKQPIYLSDLEYELMSVDGVRSVNDIVISQDFNYNLDNADNILGNLYSYNIEGGGSVDVSSVSGTTGYGYYYDFENAVVSNGSMVLPSLEPAVFELKQPNKNIKGIIR